MQLNKTPPIILVLAAFLACFWVGCRTVGREDVIGTYVANHGEGLDEIELKPDGTYIYKCELKNRSGVLNNNHWSLYYEKGKARIMFNEFHFCLSPYNETPPGYWDVQVEHSLTGTRELALDRDVNYYYIKH